MTVFGEAFEQQGRIAEKACNRQINGLASGVSLFAELLVIGIPGAKEEVLKNSKLTNWEPNSLSGLSEDF